MMNRRSFLRAAPAAGAVLAVPALAIAETKPVMTPRERLDAAIEELKSAASEIWPSADDWQVIVDGRPSMPLLLSVYDSKRGALKTHFDDGPLLAEDAGCYAYRKTA